MSARDLTGETIVPECAVKDWGRARSKVIQRAIAAPTEDRLTQVVAVRDELYELGQSELRETVSLGSDPDVIRLICELGPQGDTQFEEVAQKLLEPEFGDAYALALAAGDDASSEDVLAEYHLRQRRLWRQALRVTWEHGGTSALQPWAKLLNVLPPETALGSLPASYALNTDLANARRLYARHNAELLVIDGRFYHYTGTHWEPDETFAHRAGGELATIVQGEAAAARATFESLVAAASPDVKEKVRAVEDTKRRDQSKAADSLKAAAPDIMHALELAELLQKWALQCESRTRQRDAIELLRSMCSFDPAKLDKDPHLLNCLSGTIDLRIGKLRPHRPHDFITKCAPVTYNPAATAPRFERFLHEVMANDQSKVDFLQRWFGYAATGETREQKVMFHVGPGGGGKGTLLRAVSDVLGEYTSTAARGLITGRGGDDRHPTEIIDLRGRRLVTCHESDQSADLREGFLKQLSGEDSLKGRAMRQDFVEFRPSHKLQMLTNYPPVVQGSDYGIWRRLVLVPYDVKFGSPEDVAAGKATQLIDPTLPEALRNEREGIFAFLVRGAVEWYRVGLQVPESIRKATDTYQSDQDRAEQFVTDTFVKDATAWISNSDLHMYYQRWCVEHGYKPLGWQKLVVELRRIVGQTFVQDTTGRKVGQGAIRKTVRGCYGLRVQNDGVRFEPVSDLVGGDQP